MLPNSFWIIFGWFLLNFPCLHFVCCCDVLQVSSKNFIKLGGFRNLLSKFGRQKINDVLQVFEYRLLTSDRQPDNFDSHCNKNTLFEICVHTKNSRNRGQPAHCPSCAIKHLNPTIKMISLSVYRKILSKIILQRSDPYWIRRSLRPSMLTWRDNRKEMWHI